MMDDDGQRRCVLVELELFVILLFSCDCLGERGYAAGGLVWCYRYDDDANNPPHDDDMSSL